MSTSRMFRSHLRRTAQPPTARRVAKTLAKWCSIFIVAFIIVMRWSAPSAAIALRVDQLEFSVTAKPGETVPLSLVVENTADESALVNVYAGDWHRNPDGEHVYLDPGTLERSATQWLQIAPKEFQLKQGGSNTVRFTVTVPDTPDLNGTYWSMIFIEPNGRPSPGDGSNIRVVQRIGVKMYITINGQTKRSGQVDKVEASLKQGDDAAHVSARFTNTGTTPLTPKGWVQLVDSSGKVAARVPFKSFPILPGDANLFTSTIPLTDLTPGRYAVIAALDYGASQMVGGQAYLTVDNVPKEED